jgi:dienelactone hydrolase
MTTTLFGCLFVIAAAEAPDREAIRAKMERVMGPLPSESLPVPLDVKIVLEETVDGYVRKKITFAVEKGDRVPAWLLIPKGYMGKRPTMLCLHQTIAIGKDEPIGLGQQESKRQALHLVKRGYVCLAPDYPSFGEYPYDFKKSKFASGSMKAIWNCRKAIDFLESLAEVDKSRIGVIGHSLGGHAGMFAAAFDDRLAAVVTSCGFCSFHQYYGGNLTGWSGERYMPRIASQFGKDPKRMPFDFDDVLLAIAPRPFFTNSPQKDENFAVAGVKSVMEKVKPVYEKLGAAEKLIAVYPDARHDWPEAERTAAYEFLDRWLKP